MSTRQQQQQRISRRAAAETAGDHSSREFELLTGSASLHG